MRNIDAVLSGYHKKRKPLGKLALTALAIGTAVYLSIKGPEPLKPVMQPASPPDTVETIVHDTVVTYAPLELGDGYAIIITDEFADHPYVSDDALYSKVMDLTAGKGLEQKARTLFDWIEGLEYREGNGEPYRNSLQAFEEGKGLCAELAYLYITSARLAGLDAGYVSVDIDMKGDSVNHGCAGVQLGTGLVLVDPAYHLFDAEHKGFREVPDDEAVRLFQQWQ